MEDALGDFQDVEVELDSGERLFGRHNLFV